MPGGQAMRRPGIWFRESADAWYTTIGGKQRKLADGRKARSEAKQKLEDLLSREGRGPAPTCREVFNLFLDSVELAVSRGERSQHTYDGYERHLASASDAFGSTNAGDLKPLHVSRWIDGTTWGPTTRKAAITAVRGALNWAKRQGHLESNPIADIERPRAKRREAILTEEQADRVIMAIPDPEFRDLVVVLRETGARPGELAGLTAERVDVAAGRCRVVDKIRHRTGERLRDVYLTPTPLEIVARLAREHPDGPIFRNERGNPWSRHAMAQRCARLRKRLGMGPELSCYSLRHLYITSALERGVPIATVAVLVGHRDTQQIARVYSKLDRATDHLREAARAARCAK